MGGQGDGLHTASLQVQILELLAVSATHSHHAAHAFIISLLSINNYSKDHTVEAEEVIEFSTVI